MIGVYKITSPSNSVYIGQSWNCKIRENQYKRGADPKQRHIHNSIKKYGWKNHTFEVIEELTNPVQKELNLLEKHYYYHYKNLGFPMLNIQEPGENGGKISEETKLIMSVNRTGKKKTESFKRKISAIHKGKVISLEQRKALSIFRTGTTMSKEVRERISERMKGKPLKHSWKLKIPVLQFDLQGVFIKEWSSAKDAADFIGVDSTTITCCCKGKRQKTAYGFIWKYKDASKQKKMK